MLVIVNYKDSSYSYYKANDVEDALTKADALPNLAEIDSLLIDGEKYFPRKGE